MDYMTSSSCLKLRINNSPIRMKDVFEEPPIKSRTFSVLTPSFSLLKPKLVTQKIFQPPPFVVGGFVGSKSVEHKNSSINYSNILGQIIGILTIQETNIWNMEQPALIRSLSSNTKKTINAISSIPLQISTTNLSPCKELNSNMPDSIKYSSALTIPASSEATLTNHQAVKCDNSSIVPNCIQKADTVNMLSKANNCLEADLSSVSEVDSQSHVLFGEKTNVSSAPTNSWIKDIIVHVEDSDNDSEWDCVDDFHSENGEIVDSFKWTGDFISPISSPILPPLSMLHQQPEDFDYDSDDDSDIWNPCERNEGDEEEDKERELAEQRIIDANRRWNENIDKEENYASKSSKQVRFLSTNLVRVRPMLTWNHAYRAARKGDWERLARDSVRFRERIASVANVLEPVLDAKHRERIWKRLHSETQ